MRSPKSKFVKRIIAEFPFNEENLGYVEILLDLEQSILEGAPSMGENMRRGALQERWAREYREIQRELDPEGYARDTKPRREAAAKKRRDRAKRRLARGRAYWKKWGGKA